MATATASRKAPSPTADLLTRYASAAARSGCPREQLERFVSAGVVLQERQLQASAAARACDTADGPSEIGYGGARGGGKSHWLLAQIGVDDCQRAPGIKALILRKVGKANQENFEDLRRRLLMGIPHKYAQNRGTLTFDNGSFIVLGHFQAEKDIDKYLGLEYDVIGVEEATTLTQKKYERISTCNRTSRPEWRPRMYSTTNPGGVGHAWYKRRFITPQRRHEECETRFIPATVRDNRFLDQGYEAKLERLTGWEREAWLNGDWDILAGQFFTNWRETYRGQPHHVIPNREVPPHWRKWAALDYGFTHYTVCYLFAEDGDGNVYVVDEHAERRWLPARHAPAIHAMLARHGLTVKDLSIFVAGHDVFDKGNDEQGKTTAETYADLGIKLERANINRINGASEILTRLGDTEVSPPIPPRVFVFERCVRLIECLPDCQHDPHRPEDVLKWDTDDDGNGGDDPYDCFRYGLMAASARTPEIRFWTL